MKKRILMAALGTIVLMAACHPHRGPEQRAEWVTSKVSRELDLNEEQKAKLDAVKTTMLELRKSQESERKQHIAKAKQLITSEKLDAAQVKALINERHQHMDKNFDKVFSKVQEFHASLNPQQKQKAAAWLDKLSEHME